MRANREELEVLRSRLLKELTEIETELKQDDERASRQAMFDELNTEFDDLLYGYSCEVRSEWEAHDELTDELLQSMRAHVEFWEERKSLNYSLKLGAPGQGIPGNSISLAGGLSAIRGW